jgi:hypothetical protein
MADYFHDTLNEETLEQLRSREIKAKADADKILELAKVVDTIWGWKAYHLFQIAYGYEIGIDVARRSLNDLCAMDFIIDTGERVKSEKGMPNFVYRINPVPPVNPIKIPKSLSVSIQLMKLDDGSFDLDIEAMVNELGEKAEAFSAKLIKHQLKNK